MYSSMSCSTSGTIASRLARASRIGSTGKRSCSFKAWRICKGSMGGPCLDGYQGNHTVSLKFNRTSVRGFVKSAFDRAHGHSAHEKALHDDREKHDWRRDDERRGPDRDPLNAVFVAKTHH